MGDAPMTIPDNPLGLISFEALVYWTSSYLHFKHALQVIAFTPEAADVVSGSLQRVQQPLRHGDEKTDHP